MTEVELRELLWELRVHEHRQHGPWTRGMKERVRTALQITEDEEKVMLAATDR